MFNIRLLITVFVLIFCTAAAGIFRLSIDTDIVRSLPVEEKIIKDALDIFRSHPIQDQIAIDISAGTKNPRLLVACGKELEEALRNSGLFTDVGTSEISSLIPELALQVTSSLPLLFSSNQLKQDIAPRLNKQFIEKRFKSIHQKLSSLEGIGQSKFIINDPLGFMEPVMARMAMLAPVSGTSIHNGFVFSADKRHMLVTARPDTTGTNTATARQISELLNDVAASLAEQYNNSATNTEITLTPVGAYRAALDNERIIRHDVNLALLLSTAGIGILLFIAFPRPLLGLFSLLPALAGTAVSLLLFSLFHSSISIMVLGFGGAIISITVDHGIAYLLFLDRSKTTRGKDASREIRAIGILAVLTTCGAFLTLSFSGFPIFVQLGQFTAMGVFFSFLFVHFIFPYLTPSMPPPSRTRRLPLQGLVNALYSTGKTGAVASFILACVLLFFARPEINVSLESMNTVSEETMAADKLFTEVWGEMGNKVILMLEGNSIAALQQQNDRILRRLSKDMTAGKIDAAFSASMVFPGEEQAAQNLDDWKAFWTDDRINDLRLNLMKSSSRNGFRNDAFNHFLTILDPGFTPKATDIPEKFFKPLGISEKEGRLIQFINISPGKKYNSEDFYKSYGAQGKIFDSPYFSSKLAKILFNSFLTMLAIIATSIVALLLLFFASWQLALITLTPPLFSYVCTLGTMKLISHPLDIPGLMLSIVILGMGIDYSIFFVRAHQRYRDSAHPAFSRVRMAVFMAGSSTIIGFGVLCLADHSLLRSIGITSLLGIGYSLLGAFLLLPPLLEIYFKKESPNRIVQQDIIHNTRDRFRLMEAYPRMFARFKLQYDPMFTDLPELLHGAQDRITTILDIGCGYGIPGCWCLEYFPNAKIYGVDPDNERVRVAALAMGDRGQIVENAAPELPVLPHAPDLVLLLDMLHYLDDLSVQTLFTNCFQGMAHRGIVLARFVTRPDGVPSLSWKLEEYRIKLAGKKTYYRDADTMAVLLKEAGFQVKVNSVSRSNQELVWLMGCASKK